MNMITPEKYLMKDSEAAESPALKRLMAAWESKQAKNARKAGGLGLVAVSLAACGSSSSSDPDPDPVDPVGMTYLLTIGDDIIEGTAGDDIFNAPLATATGSLTGILSVQTLGENDILDGGEGVDTLNATLNNTILGIFPPVAPVITNIEIYNLTAHAFGGGLDLSNASGYEQLWNINSAGDLALLEVGEAAAIGMRGTAGNTEYFIQYNSSAVDDIASQVVIANNVGGSTVSGLFTTLNVVDPYGDSIIDLDLLVSNGVRLILEGSVANIENLTIDGSGLLVLFGQNAFANLVTLDSTGYDGDLELDISGGGTLESVMTGDGDDVIYIAAATFSAETPPTTVDLGEGANRLVLGDTVSTPLVYTGGWTIDSAELSALDFTLATVSNVQTLELYNVGLDADASLALEGVGGLETLVFDDFNNGGGHDLEITGAPEVLLISATEEMEMNGGLLTIEGAVDLTIESTGTGDSDIRIDGGLNSETLETLVINAADDAALYAYGGLEALTSIEVNALGDFADVYLQDLDDEFDVLANVLVTAADDADLVMVGRSATAQTQTLTIAPGTASTWNFTVPGVGAVVLNTPLTVTQAGAATALSAAMNADPAFDDYTISAVGNTVQIVNNVAGSADPIVFDGVSAGGQGFAAPEVIVPGEDGTGFEALETLVVDAADDAYAYLQDVYGAFTLEVTAIDDAYVYLTNTNATEVSITAGDYAEVFAWGTAHGNPDLVSLTITADTAYVDLSGDLGSMETIDLTGVVTSFEVYAGFAEFDPAVNDYVTYLIGGTDGIVDAEYSYIDAAAAREVFKFTEADFGTIVIDGFNAGADPLISDRLDLSDLGYTGNVAELVRLQGDFNAVTGEFVANAAGTDTMITDLVGGSTDFSGSIVLIGVLPDDLTGNIL